MCYISHLALKIHVVKVRHTCAIWNLVLFKAAADYYFHYRLSFDYVSINKVRKWTKTMHWNRLRGSAVTTVVRMWSVSGGHRYFTYGDVVPGVGLSRRLSGSRQTGVCGPISPEAFGLSKQVRVETNHQPASFWLNGLRKLRPTKRTYSGLKE